MNKEKTYFMKQKIYGLLGVSLAVIMVLISYKLIIPALMLASIGLYSIATKEKVFTDSYFFETYEEDEEDEI